MACAACGDPTDVASMVNAAFRPERETSIAGAMMDGATAPPGLGDAHMRWQDRISSDPGTCHGSACVKGTRVLVSTIVDSVAAGESADEIANA